MAEENISVIPKIINEAYADYIVPLRTTEREFLDTYEPQGASILNNYYGLIHDSTNIDPFFNIKLYGYAGIPKLFTLLDTTSLDISGITQVQTQPFFNLTGKNIIMGYIDTGIDYTQKAFKNSSGNTRIISIWDQTIQTGPAPFKMTYGTEYTEQEINNALSNENPFDIVPSRDTNGHGTFIAGVGSGSRDISEDFTGVAPECDIAVVKLKQAKQYLRNFYFTNPAELVYQESDIMLAIRHLAFIGERQKKPVVICISLGTNQGDHNGNAPIDVMISTVQTLYPNVTIVIAGGNEAGRSHHFFGEIKPNKEFNEVEILVPDDAKGFFVELWGDAPNIYSVGLVSPLGEVVQRIGVRLGKTEELAFVLDNSSVQIVFEIIQTTSGAQLIFLRFARPTKGIWKIRVFCNACKDSKFNMWLPITKLLEKDVTFISANPDTTITIPGYATNALTTSTYNAYDQSIYLFSSRGFSRSGNIKPDFASPGVNVQGPNLSSGYTTSTGSSVAAAIAAGCVVLLLQWGTQRNPPRYFITQELRVLLIRGASRSDALTYPNKEWGYGKLNIYNIFLSLVGN